LARCIRQTGRTVLSMRRRTAAVSAIARVPSADRARTPRRASVPLRMMRSLRLETAVDPAMARGRSAGGSARTPTRGRAGREAESGKVRRTQRPEARFLRPVRRLPGRLFFSMVLAAAGPEYTPGTPGTGQGTSFPGTFPVPGNAFLPREEAGHPLPKGTRGGAVPARPAAGTGA